MGRHARRCRDRVRSSAIQAGRKSSVIRRVLLLLSLCLLPTAARGQDAAAPEPVDVDIQSSPFETNDSGPGADPADRSVDFPPERPIRWTFRYIRDLEEDSQIWQEEAPTGRAGLEGGSVTAETGSLNG